ncbi:hypothetical protein [Novosphingobium album (ex Liu et al. 2023)]|uniref:Uncharacterized protein n=1 Tax=Novosphingobium album (ex Liu et al. 2023) TaxID=3031130 RepID=A0ABT5WV63_9SPHN|nr:hypothetical protein [Novosphingobium album (ex Liu et al. 2023)]MDE8653806.1 hypothetical protein [Novosphingobium album (ex Liu et al. 2023)]
MDATPISKADARPPGAGQARAGGPPFGHGSASALSMKWSALHDAAAAVAAIAGVEAPPMPPAVRNFPVVIRDAGGWRRALAEQHVDDLAAIMEPGLAALLSAYSRGVTPLAAARALWEEFVRARDAVLALCPPGGSPRRVA